MRRMLLIHPSDEMYGADRVTLQLALIAKKNGWDVTVWLPNDVDYADKWLSSRLSSCGVSVKSMSLPVLRRQYLTPLGLAQLFSRLITSAPSLYRSVHSGAYDVVWVNTMANILMLPILRLAAKDRIVMHVHEIPSRAEAAILGLMLRLAKQVVAVSKATATALRHNNIRVLYNGFPPPDVNDGPPMPSTESGRVFLLASRWNAWKGHETLLNAWAIAGEPGQLFVLGGPPLSGERFDVRARVDELKLRNVTLVGETDLVARYISGADIVLVPSTDPDPLPTIAIEAMQLGTPVLASQIGGLPEIVEDGVSGWLVQPGNVQAWADALLHVCAADLTPFLAAAMTQGQRFSSARFETEALDVIEAFVQWRSH
jgi:glycosyltransferase involved in cell wall biosynthesis